MAQALTGMTQAVNSVQPALANSWLVNDEQKARFNSLKPTAAAISRLRILER